MRLAILAVLATGCGRIGFGDVERAVDAPGSGSAGPAVDGAAGSIFFDPFERADGVLGNGWVEHNAGVFAIVDKHVTRVPGGDWTTNQVHRVDAEALRDVEVGIEVTLDDVSDAGADWPQVFVRATIDGFEGYYAWVELGPTASGTRPFDLARKPADQDWWTSLATTQVPAAAAGDRYRIRLRATGAAPVHLEAWYDVWTGTAWDTSIAIAADDADPDAITAPATWGFSGHTGDAATGAAGPYTYDNFSATAL